MDQVSGRVEEMKASPHTNSQSPIASVSATDKRAELRRIEQERRRREAVSTVNEHFTVHQSNSKSLPIKTVIQSN